MTARGFAQAICEQIQGFGEYGFPESHAASFALLTYASAWLKCHEPAAFLCALLNSQPMGFYSPSQLVQDARRHGVEVRAVDVTVSGWDAALEPGPGDGQGAPAVRLGMAQLRGMRAEAARRVSLARAARAFADVADLALRAELDRHDLQVLAGNRRQALWQAAGALPGRDLLRAAAPPPEAAPLLPAPSEGDEIVADYRAQSLTLGRHPLALLRPHLLARACGLVTVRQRPGTAKGVLFMTLEDETGTVNVIVWPALLGVYGVWQREGAVRHLVARRLVDLSALLQTRSRDFC